MRSTQIVNPTIARSLWVALVPAFAFSQTAADLEAGKKAFEGRCGVCHGADGKGGGYAPNIVTPGVVPSRRYDLHAQRQTIHRHRHGKRHGRFRPTVATSKSATTELWMEIHGPEDSNFIGLSCEALDTAVRFVDRGLPSTALLPPR